MDVEFDAAKDAINVTKHGISLVWASKIEIEVVVRDERANYGEDRFNGFGLIDGVTYCLTYTLRGETIRAISLRRARQKEYSRHVH